jgi:8-oxo-dGTP diphosphatase
MQTVAPLAAARNLRVEEEPRLAEGGSAAVLLELGADLAAAGAVFCSHGDVIQELLWLLVGDGIVGAADARLEKASTWVLEMARGRVEAAHRLAAP